MMTPGCPPHFPSRSALLARACATLRLVVVALGTVTLLGVAGCGGDPESPPPMGGGNAGGGTGSGGGGGSGNGGNRGNGGSGGSGSSPDGGGGGGSTQPASVRFCNGVSGSGGPVVVEIQIGNSKAQTESSTCASPCLSVPAGTSKVTFRMGGAEVFAQDITFDGGQHYGVIAAVDGTTKKVTLSGGKLPDGQQCGGYNPFGVGKTVGKFCHSLTVEPPAGQQPAPLELELAVGDVRLKATTGGCSSPLMQMCAALPAGPVTATVTNMGQNVASQMLTLDPTKAYLFGLAVDATTKRPVITAKELASAMDCPSAVPTTTMKFCNRLPASAATPGVVEIVTQDGVRFTAKPGECAPAKGTACNKVAAGKNVITISIDGEEVATVNAGLPADREMVLRLALNGSGQAQFALESVPTGMMCATYEPPL